MRRGATVVATAATAAVLVAACTGDPHYVELGDETVSSSAPDEPASADAAPGEADSAVEVAPTDDAAGPADDPVPAAGTGDGLILVLDVEGGDRALATYRPDGELVTALQARDDDTLIWQPIWSPDGERVAWARSDDAIEWELVIAGADGGDPTTFPLPNRPDYLTFDPTGNRILSLTPSPQGFGIVIVPVGPDADGQAEVIDLGRPYFSDFSPDGARLISHVGTSLRVIELGGEATPLPVSSNGHQTPAWLPDGTSIVVTRDGDSSNQLVMIDLTSGGVTELGEFQRFVLLAVDPTGARVALSSFGGAVTGDGGTSALAPIDDRGGLWVVELESGDATRLLDRPTSAPMWDPTGRRILVRDAIVGTGEWTVFDLDGPISATGELDVGDSLMPAYLPFWDQFGRSQTVWSPGGDRFVHVGAEAGGTAGVWVHDLESDESTFVADGDVAFWSPS